MTNKPTPVWAIVPASGIGRRMSKFIPKQYLKLSGKTVIEHTLDRLLSFEGIDGVILVINPEDSYWHDLDYQSSRPLVITKGGKERQHSVYNGLKQLKTLIKEECYALVHDAVRPLVSHQDIDRVIKAARESEDGAILASPLSDSIKRQDGNGDIECSVAREGLWRAFTPQVFKASLLMRGLQSTNANNIQVTDEASAIEALGLRPRLVEGEANNIKITLPQDMILAEQILQHQSDLNLNHCN